VEFAVSLDAPEALACDALGVGIVADGTALEGAAARVDKALGGLLSAMLAEEKFDAKLGSTLLLHTHGRIPARKIIAAGLGPKNALTLDHLRRAAAVVVRQAARVHAAHVGIAPALVGSLTPEVATQARVEGAILGAYRFLRYKRDDAGHVARVTLLAADPAQQKLMEAAVARGRLFADATVFARDLVNEPPNHLPPVRLAEIATEAAHKSGLKCSVLDVDAMKALGMEALLAIGMGSDQPPRLIVLEYSPARARKTIALVGKGVCYDSGGLNLKTQDLAWMKSDMAGGAAVLATLQALPALRAPVRVLGVVAAVENLPSGHAVKPGDIVRAMNGKTIEINNTDAEGRVILADALAYAAQQRPDEIIDLATLTGSAMVALGYLAAAVMGNDPPLIQRLLGAAQQAGERLWELPLYEEFLDNMRSPIADLRNSGSRYGGAQKGGIFMREFVDGRPWAHLDIAPTAFLEKEEGTSPYLPSGATGYGVRTLLTYLAGSADSHPTN
jgi:leucyl aminopeptidase